MEIARNALIALEKRIAANDYDPIGHETILDFNEIINDAYDRTHRELRHLRLNASDHLLPEPQPPTPNATEERQAKYLCSRRIFAAKLSDAIRYFETRA
jgi:hypothetical protein